MTPSVDVVIVSYNSRDTLRECVEPLAGVPGVSVTVVDNQSTDRSLESIADLPVRAIPSGRNGGFGFGCNLGSAAGDAPFVLFLNPDARIAARDVERLVHVLEAEPDVAVAGPRIVDVDGSLFHSMRRYQRVGSTWATALFLHRLFTRASWANEIIRAPEAYERASYPEWLSGSCLMVRRSALERVEGFDESFFLYGEDMDLCARIRAGGDRVRYEPGAHAIHEGGHSAPRVALYAVLAQSRMRFARGHSGTASAALQCLGLAVGAVTHLLASAQRPAQRQGHAAALRAIIAGSRAPAYR
jgi:N-acetylglucosaminyl-diphospho-decaprenol L-rhamnosyltransferase